MIDIRTGLGYDVHIFGEGDHVWLGGVKISHDQGVVAHSDGEVVLHALTDAILGALSKGDIGDHFPPSDARWKDCASRVFLAHAAKIAKDEGFAIGNVDMTVIAEAPKIGPHRDRICETIAQILDIDRQRVSIKATTNEKLGFVGRREGIAAHAIATLIKETS